MSWWEVLEQGKEDEWRMRELERKRGLEGDGDESENASIELGECMCVSVVSEAQMVVRE